MGASVLDDAGRSLTSESLLALINDEIAFYSSRDSRSSFSFLELPAEIRIVIYDFVFCKTYTELRDWNTLSEQGAHRTGDLVIPISWNIGHVASFIGTNRQIHIELGQRVSQLSHSDFTLRLESTEDVASLLETLGSAGREKAGILAMN